jgi:hypothetical protein
MQIDVNAKATQAEPLMIIQPGSRVLVAYDPVHIDVDLPNDRIPENLRPSSLLDKP